MPTLCKTSVVFRALILVHLLMAAYQLVHVTTVSGWLSRMGTLALVVEPVLLGWFVLMCPVAKLSGTLPKWLQTGVAVCLAAGLTFFFVFLVQFLPIGGSWIGWLPLRAPFVAMLLAGAFLYYLELEVRGLRNAETQLMLSELQERIRPHFFFNALNSASALIASDPKQAERVLDNLSTLFRSIISRKQEKQSLKDELSLCQRYLEIEQIRFGERMTLEWKIQSGSDDYMLPILSVQPLVENAVKHGVETSVRPCKITIVVRRSMTHLVIEVSNTVSGSKNHKGSGTALDNIQKRLKLLYDVNAKFEQNHGDKLHTVTLHLPL